MSEDYSAFGLQLRSSFPLLGMAPTAAVGLPSLRLSLETPVELREAWRGVDGAGSWRGSMSDGNELVIERGEGDLLFSYGSLAQFHLDPTGGRLACAPTDLTALAWQRVLLDRVLPHASLAFGREALHAAAVETPLGVIAIAAAGGTGKSTLAAEMVRRGHAFFCDDILVLSGEGAVEAHPGAPHMSLDLAGGDAPVQPPLSASTLGLLAGERWIAVGEAAAREASRVAAIVLLERGAGLPLGVRPLPTSPLTLAPFMLGLPDDEGRDAGRFALYSDLVDSASLLGLSGDAGDRPGDFADALEEAVGLGIPAVGRGVA